MNKQLELVAADRTISGKQVKRLRHQGIVPGVLFGHNQESVSLQVEDLALKKLLARGGNNVVLLKVGDRPPVQALIKQVQRDAVSGRTTHVDFYRISATEKLKARVPLHFVNAPTATGLTGAVVSRPLSEVLVECLSSDLPASIQVDLARLDVEGATIRVEDLKVDPAVTILIDHSEIVATLQQRRATVEKPEEVAEKAEAITPTPETPEK